MIGIEGKGVGNWGPHTHSELVSTLEGLMARAIREELNWEGAVTAATIGIYGRDVRK